MRLGAMVFLLTHVELAAQDRLHPCGLGVVKKVHGAKDVAMVGHSHGRHVQLLGALAELLGVAGAIKHRVVGMQM